jgi:hypothetical protein
MMVDARERRNRSEPRPVRVNERKLVVIWVAVPSAGGKRYDGTIRQGQHERQTCCTDPVQVGPSQPMLSLFVLDSKQRHQNVVQRAAHEN